jgi:hypothetical protein
MKASACAALFATILTGSLLTGAQQGHEMPKPGKQHEALKYFEGTWDTDAKFMTEPGKPMAESKGTERAEMVLGGFWLAYEYKGEMLGSPFTGRGTMGFDQQKRKYVGTWIDSMKSGLFLSEGTADEDGKVFTMMTQGYCDGEGRSITMKQVYEIKDKDTWTLSFLTPNPDGKEMTTGTIEYRRRR